MAPPLPPTTIDLPSDADNDKEFSAGPAAPSRIASRAGSSDDDDAFLDLVEDREIHAGEGSEGEAEDDGEEDDVAGGKEVPDDGKRVCMNGVEKIWALHAGLAFKCPTKNGTELRKTVEKFVVPRLVDLVTSMKDSQRRDANVLVRGGYRKDMANVSVATVVNFFTKGIRSVRKSVVVEDGPQAAVRASGNEQDATHQLHQLCLDWYVEHGKTMGGSDEGAAAGKSRMKGKKETAGETRKRRAEQYAAVTKRTKEEKEAEKAEVRAERVQFNLNMEKMVGHAGGIASSLADATRMQLALTNHRLFNILPAAALTLAPPQEAPTPPAPVVQAAAPSPLPPPAAGAASADATEGSSST